MPPLLRRCRLTHTPRTAYGAIDVWRLHRQVGLINYLPGFDLWLIRIWISIQKYVAIDMKFWVVKFFGTVI